MIGGQHDERERSARKVLLVLQIFVRSDHDAKTAAFGCVNEVAIAQLSPSHLARCFHLKPH